MTWSGFGTSVTQQPGSSNLFGTGTEAIWTTT